jgi:NAD(P)-dependent dehydrogenase (short-subunit alcohol dehydrogenase family)
MILRHSCHDKDALVASLPAAHVLTREANMTLEGKNVVVLGGTSGIGLATAQAAARAGATVTVASSSTRRIEAALATLPTGARGERVDLASEAAIGALLGRVGRLDHLVFTAGEPLQLMPLAELDLQAARRFFELRYFGALAAAKLAAPRMAHGGSIVLTSGIAMLRPRQGWALGASICGAVESLTRALAVELAPIRVNVVLPGIVRTDLWSTMSEAERMAMYRTVGAALPVGRVGEADEIAQAYLYFMSNGFTTGQSLVIDGGAVLT